MPEQCSDKRRLPKIQAKLDFTRERICPFAKCDKFKFGKDEKCGLEGDVYKFLA